MYHHCFARRCFSPLTVSIGLIGCSLAVDTEQYSFDATEVASGGSGGAGGTTALGGSGGSGGSAGSGGSSAAGFGGSSAAGSGGSNAAGAGGSGTAGAAGTMGAGGASGAAGAGGVSGSSGAGDAGLPIDITPPTVGPITRQPGGTTTTLGASYTFAAPVSDDFGVIGCVGTYSNGSEGNILYSSDPAPLQLDDGAATVTIDNYFGFDFLGFECQDAAGNVGESTTPVPEVFGGDGTGDTSRPSAGPVVFSQPSASIGVPIDLNFAVQDDTGVIGCDITAEDVATGVSRYYKAPGRAVTLGTVTQRVTWTSSPGFLDSGAGTVSVRAECYDVIFQYSLPMPVSIEVGPSQDGATP